MEIAAFVIGCLAFVLSICSLEWQVWSWRHAHHFDVRVWIRPQLVRLGSGKYEITVVVSNDGATSEAVHRIALLYAGHVRQYGDSMIELDPQSLQDAAVEGTELPPRRDVRRTYDLLASRFGIFPSEITGYVDLQSGHRLEAPPFRTDRRSLDAALGRSRRRPKARPRPYRPVDCRLRQRDAPTRFVASSHGEPGEP